jgi:hypothetical protein
VYRPLLLTVPYAATHTVPTLEVNCCVAPRVTLALLGEMPSIGVVNLAVISRNLSLSALGFSISGD